MPPLTPPSKILVTGGTGYIGAWVIRTLLADGFSVRAVVRSASKALPLQDHFTNLDADENVRRAAGEEGRLEYVYVEDFVREGAFDAVVEGVEGILHLASPIKMGDGPADEFIIPAVSSTLNLLRAASLPPSTVKRFIYTSSTASVSRPLSPPSPSSPSFPSFETTIFDESDWGTDVELLKSYEEKGMRDEAPFMVKYRASKTLAERAAGEWVKNLGERGAFDLVVLNPPFVFGPPLIRTLPLGTSVDWWFRTVIQGESNDKPDVLNYKGAFSYVDVRDYARANVEGLRRAGAGGERVIVAAGALTWQEAIDITNALAPSLAPLHTPFTKGIEGLTLAPLAMRYGNEKSKRVLGMGYRTYEETVRDMVGELSVRGM